MILPYVTVIVPITILSQPPENFPCLAVDPAKQDGVVYRIPREWGKVYIGETGRPMQDRIKEYDRDIRLARTEQITDQQGSKYTNQSC